MAKGLKEKIDSIDINNIQKISKYQWIFAGAIGVLAFLAWFSFYSIVYQVSGGVGNWVFSLFAFIAFAISVGLSFFLLNPKYLAIATYFITAVLGFLFFGWRGIEIIAVLVFFFTTSAGYLFVRREQKNLIPFWYSRLIRRGMPIFFTGLAFALALFYSASPIGRASEAPQLSEGFISVMAIPLEYSLRAYVPDFRTDMLVSDVEKLEGAELIRGYVSRISVEEKGKTVIEFLTNLINSQISAILLPYKQFLPFVYLFGLFLVFRAIAMPIMWISMGVGWLIIKIMLKFKFLELKKVNVEKEELVL